MKIQPERGKQKNTCLSKQQQQQQPNFPHDAIPCSHTHPHRIPGSAATTTAARPIIMPTAQPTIVTVAIPTITATTMAPTLATATTALAVAVFRHDATTARHAVAEAMRTAAVPPAARAVRITIITMTNCNDRCRLVRPVHAMIIITLPRRRRKHRRLRRYAGLLAAVRLRQQFVARPRTVAHAAVPAAEQQPRITAAAQISVDRTAQHCIRAAAAARIRRQRMPVSITAVVAARIMCDVRHWATPAPADEPF